MTPQRVKQAIDTRLLNNVSFRLNSGRLEYNDGTGWKSVGDVEYTPYSAFPEITLSDMSWQTLVNITGEGNVERALLTSSADSPYEFRITIDGVVRLYVKGSATKRAIGLSAVNSGLTPVTAEGPPLLMVMSVGAYTLSSVTPTFDTTGPVMWDSAALQCGVCFTAAPIKFKTSLKIEVRKMNSDIYKVRATVFGGVK